ncbi:MAG TPA: GAF domain-containing protein [Anaerolineaceae bacterium]|nr:GAF domain-containing protein [Anaerolineaceae bacterium]
MSKKQITNRLNLLFAEFEESEPVQPAETRALRATWSWDIDLDGKYRQCSAGVAESLGFLPDSFLGRSIFTYAISPECSGQLKSALNSTHFPVEIEIIFFAKTSELVTVRTTILQSIDENEKVTGWHGLNFEIDRKPIPKNGKDHATNKAGKNKAEPVTEEESPVALTQDQGVAIKDTAQPPAEKKKFSYQSITQKTLTAPIQVSGKTEALIEVTGENSIQKWSEDDRLLVEEIARQLSLAIENARLYQDIRKALAALETRERYQANIARAVAILSKSGSSGLSEYLEALGQATQCAKITLTTFNSQARGWRSMAVWINQDYTVFSKSSLWKIDAEAMPNWRTSLQENGWATGSIKDAPYPENDYLRANNIGSTLLIGVTFGGTNEAGFIAFDQVDENKVWQNEEISLLRVAADALSNTTARQDLLVRLQSSLKETESLYNTSHRLALATDLSDMVTVIMSGLESLVFNRAVLILFETQAAGKPAKIRVSANWFSGKGTPPAAVGTEFPPELYLCQFEITDPTFFTDIFEDEIDPALRDLLSQQNARSVAIFPLWANKKQIGVFWLLSDEKRILNSNELRSYPPLIDQMATAIENLSLFRQTQKALSETELLYQVSNRIAQATDTSELVRLVSQKMLPKNAEAGSIFIASYNADDKITDLELAGFVTTNGHYQPAGAKIPIAALPFVLNLSQDIVIIPDIFSSQLDPVSQKTLQQLNILSACIVPLRSAGKLVGLLVASARSSTNFPLDEAHLLQVAGSGISVALERQRLLNEAQRRALELQTAAEIARDTTSTLSLDTLLERIVTLLSGQFNYYHVAIYLLDEQGKYAVIREANGDAGKVMRQQGYKLAAGTKSAVGLATMTGQSSIYNDVNLNPYYIAHPLLPNTHSQMAIPLRLGDRIIGALDIHSTQLNAFNPDDISVLQILADQIAVAIENARSYELSQKALADIQEVDRLKSQFLANMSHELRTPLNSIIGFSRVILKGIDGSITDTQKQDLNAIYNSGQHLLALITDILDLSKIEAGKMELQLAEINLGDLINSAMSTAVGLVKDKPIRLVHLVPPDLPTPRADATRVRQVLINFISNAAKFTEEGSITVEAKFVEGPQHGKEVMVTVTDTGLGIAVEDQSKLFQPFSQVDDSPTRKTGGTGLGLSISRSLVEMHNGRIGLLHSEIGKGSTFFFTLPLHKETNPAPAFEGRIGEKIILSIDDDMQVISLYERYLKPSGFKVIALTDPKKALLRAKQVKPFAITLDIMMPEKDGWDVLQELKNDQETRQIPIIICSILDDEEKGFNLGAADYLVKPFLQEELINTINRLNSDGKISKILVIDDDQTDLRLVEKMLNETKKFQVLLAEGGQKGWEAIQSQAPDAIILDLFMPGLDGFTLLEEMREINEYKDIPVVILTGADLTSEQHAKLAEFGQHLLAKASLQESELLSSLQTALQSIKK